MEQKKQTLVKSWPVSFGKQELRRENEPQFYIGIFECPNARLDFGQDWTSSRIPKRAEPESNRLRRWTIENLNG